MLSLNGKKASEHKIEPFRFFPDFLIAISTASTRLTWPAPTPIVTFSLTIIIPLDFTCFNTFQPKSMVFNSAVDGFVSVTILRFSSCIVEVSVSCTKIPPSTLRTSILFSREETFPTSKTRRFFFLASMSSAFESKVGAITISTNTLDISCATSCVQVRFKAIIPPKADRLSASKARVYTSRRLFPSATPHGLACFTITQAVSSNSFKQERAASASIILL